MSLVFRISGQLLWISFLLFSLSSSCEASKGNQIPKVLNWCSQNHCQDCRGSEVLICANGALSSRFGDLCGCCHSCVQIQDLRASCGSQLAVRTSSANFEDSRSRVTVLATTTCKAGLVCTNFICESLDDRIDRVSAALVERDDENIEQKLKTSKNDISNSEESDDLITNLINDEKAEHFYYPHRNYEIVEVEQPMSTKNVSTTRETDHLTSTSMRWPILLTSKMTSSIGIGNTEVPLTRRDVKESDVEFGTYESPHEIKYDPKNIRDSSGHLVNVIIANREFQLIYGNEALIDLEILLNSVNKSQSTLIFDEIEAPLVYERFKNVIEQLNSSKGSSVLRKVTNNVSTTAQSRGQPANETKRLIKTIRDSEALAVLRQFMVPRSLKLTRLRLPTRQFRRKRELENAEEANPRSEYSEIVVYDFLNKTPRTMEDSSRHWLIARQVGMGSEEELLTSRSSDPEGMESAINIHITGIPRSSKSSGDFDLVEEAETRDRRTVTAGEEYANYDDALEIFVTDASTDLPEFSGTDEDQRNSSNFTISPMSQGVSDLENESDEVDNVTEKYWDTSIIGDKNSRYSDNNYEFTFPETPVILENDDYHDFNTRINETVDEFKAQLDRIETKVVVIESSLYDMIMKIEANERSKNIRNRKIAKDSASTFFPYSRTNFTENRRTIAINQSPKSAKSEDPNQLIRRYVLLPKPKVIHPNENSTSTYLSLLPNNKNGRNFNVEDEGIAQFIPIRSNRQWRTVTLQPNSIEAQNILQSRGRRYPSQNGRNRVINESQERRRKATQRSTNSGHREAIRSNARRVSKEDPLHSTEQIQSPILISKADTKSYSVTKAPNLFSRERYSLRFTTDPSRPSRQVIWPLNPAWNRPLSADIIRRKSAKANPRGGGNLEIEETSPIEESISMLETQIPKSVVRSRMSNDFDKRMARSSTSREAAMMPMAASMRRSFNDEDDWNRNSWDEGPSLNLFVVNGESKSEFGGEALTSSRESYETPFLSLENENSEVENNWEIAYPAYLDYSERQRRDEEPENDETPIVEADATEASINLRRGRRNGAKSVERRKRNAVDVLQAEKADGTISAISRNVSASREGTIENKRSKRSVQMVDWLRAAQEYHERLHQVRNAALRTWLASREELADGNLTNVKLFTREIPSYLEKYTPSFTAEDDSMLKSEASHDNPQISMFDDDESFADFLPNQSSALDNETKSNNSSNEMNSSVARKFTIIATGNSTIRIEELPETNEDDKESFFVDQSAEGSSDSELSVARQMALAIGNSEDFDHMYESVDAEDEDFDYGDPNFALSRWLDEVDIIDASSVEIPDDKTKSTNDDSSNVEEDYEVDELLSRSKRDTPLFLFKVKGNPHQDVVVWPSNWKDFINRHFQRNRTRNSAVSPTRTPKRTQKISKIGSAKTANFDTKVRTSLDRDAEMLSSETTNPEEYEKDSSLKLGFARSDARSLQHAFDNRRRQGRRKNNHRNI